MKNYDKKQRTSCLMYFANLYGWAISQKLSVKCFKWKKNVTKF